MRRDVFQAIADPTRREIITLLSHEAMNLNAVADNFNISRPAISRHIKILTECGLIMIEQEGRERYCHANLKQLQEVHSWTAHFSAFWDKKLNALKTFVETEHKNTKNKKRK
ncbi:MAG: ArsR/SmtB family transcription factor [Flavipsychrobacter sp.]